MTVDLVTKDDLQKFKRELIEEITKLLSKDPPPTKQWLRSIEVRKMLSISPGTLQNLRINGQLKYTKVGGTMYYEANDIAKMMAKK